MKIAIAGYGLEGEANYRYYSADTSNQVFIVDEKQQPDRAIPDGAGTIIGEGAFEKLQDFDLVVRTAGLAPRKIKTSGKIWSSTNEFFSNCPCRIIGVTGTKGKGTTASLISSILEAAGKKVWLVGNIGKSALEIISQIKADDIVVYELSSFQLWDFEYSPHVAVVLFIEQEHLDVHLDIGEYVEAKANITKNQSSNDLLVYNRSNNYAIKIANQSNAKLVGYQDSKTAHIAENCFYYGEQKICSVDSMGIVGEFNYDNACAAIDAIWGITNNIAVIEKGLSSFKGLPHRLELIREVNSVKYYDDSIATIPGAAIAALRAFEAPKVIILGGSSKKSDFKQLGLELSEHDVKAILIGQEADNIAQSCQSASFFDFEIIKNPTMDTVVRRASELSKPGGVVLLSPACASFGLFKNYSDRGEQFADAVNSL